MMDVQVTFQSRGKKKIAWLQDRSNTKGRFSIKLQKRTRDLAKYLAPFSNPQHAWQWPEALHINSLFPRCL